MSTVIKVEGLSKSYVIGHKRQESYQTLRDTLAHGTTRIGKRLLHPFRSSCGQPLMGVDDVEEFWALKDVSFEVKRGDRLGIIGRNGAGKSTLLKLLSRITGPSSGRIMIKGRVASLLEVGTGFHPELTGRENIFLNGAVLGMSRVEIKNKFEEIVAFAEVERFLDTPVKRYSSGMYVRLAFAVAAHLEPEILIVDEVLAVGDTQFQKKCLGKMEEVGKEGRTVLFVSHNMAAMQNLCSRAILIKNGELIADDKTNSVVENYLSTVAEYTEMNFSERVDRQGSGDIKFLSLYFENNSGERLDYCISGSYVKIIIEIENTVREKISNVVFSLGIDDYRGSRIAVVTSEAILGPVNLLSSKDRIEIIFPKTPFPKGRYTYTLFCSGNGKILDWIQQAGSFMVESGDFYGTGRVPPVDQGGVLFDYKFIV